MDDLISRQAAIAYAISGKTRNFDGDKWIRVSEVRENLKIMPSAQPERKKARWIDNETSYADGILQTCNCSECGRKSTRPLGDFCRWCGADCTGGYCEEECMKDD